MSNCIEDQHLTEDLDPHAPKKTNRRMKDGSFLHNCYIHYRDNEKALHLFYQDGRGRTITAYLNGYAIIPIEEFLRLKDGCGEDVNFSTDAMLKKVEETDRALYS